MNKIDLSKDPVMQDLRKSIDNFDRSFMRLLAERMRVAEKIMFIKRQKKIEIPQSSARKADVNQLIESISNELDLDMGFFRKILELVFQGALEQFREIRSPETLSIICQDFSLDDLRLSLLNLEKSIFYMLTERFRIVKTIGRYKKKLDVEPLDPSRWQQVLENKKEMAKQLNLNVKMIEDVFNTIHDAALDIEEIVEEESKNSQ